MTYQLTGYDENGDPTYADVPDAPSYSSGGDMGPAPDAPGAGSGQADVISGATPPNSDLSLAQQYASYGAGGGGAGNTATPGSGMDNGTMGASSASGSGVDWAGLLKTLGLTNSATGNTDWSKVLGLGLGGASLISSLNQPAYQAKTPAQLLAGMPSNAPTWSAAQKTAMQTPMKSGTALQRVAAANMPSSIVAGVRGYAEGGEVQGPLSQVAPPGPSGPQAFTGPVPMDAGGGQDDLFPAHCEGSHEWLI